MYVRTHVGEGMQLDDVMISQIPTIRNAGHITHRKHLIVSIRIEGIAQEESLRALPLNRLILRLCNQSGWEAVDELAQK